MIRAARHVDHLRGATEERQLDPRDVYAETARHQRVAELMEQHGPERQKDDHQAAQAAEPQQHDSEQHQETQIDLDREAEHSAQAP
jgi:hypothetical protein